jgi:hypothetical protein
MCARRHSQAGLNKELEEEMERLSDALLEVSIGRTDAGLDTGQQPQA